MKKILVLIILICSIQGNLYASKISNKFYLLDFNTKGNENFSLNIYHKTHNSLLFLFSIQNQVEIIPQNNFFLLDNKLRLSNLNRQNKFSQQNFEPEINKDTNKINWKLLGTFIGLVTTVNISLYYIFKDAYWNESKTKFHSFNDWNNADLNIDKIGHFYAGMLLSKASYDILKASNVPEKYSVLFSTLSSIFFQTQIEFHDAYYARWGWSWWDFSMNVLGAAFPHIQNNFKPLQLINLKWSYHPSPSYKKGWFDYWIKDYEGFTYWLSLDIHSLLPNRIKKYYPNWLNIAVGYGVEKVKLSKTQWNSANGRGLGEREFYLALDYDLVKLFKPKSELLNKILNLLNNFHFPAPAIRLTPSRIYYGIYF